MAEYKERSGYCPHCQKKVVGRREEASHTFWLIATLFSCGLFAIVWIISSLVKSGEPFHCAVCGTALQAFPGAAPNKASSTSSMSSSTKTALIVVGVLLVLPVTCGLMSAIGGAIKPTQPTSSQVSTAPSAPPYQPASTPLPQKIATPNLQNEARMRRAWAVQYQARKQDDFPDAVCSVSGKNNTILHLRTFAVVAEEPIQTLANSGYFKEVWEQGFTKMVFEDTVGHEVDLTHY